MGPADPGAAHHGTNRGDPAAGGVGLASLSGSRSVSGVGRAVLGGTVRAGARVGWIPGRGVTRRVPDVGRAARRVDPERCPDLGLTSAGVAARIRTRPLMGRTRNATRSSAGGAPAVGSACSLLGCASTAPTGRPAGGALSPLMESACARRPRSSGHEQRLGRAACRIDLIATHGCPVLGRARGPASIRAVRCGLEGAGSTRVGHPADRGTRRAACPVVGRTPCTSPGVGRPRPLGASSGARTREADGGCASAVERPGAGLVGGRTPGSSSCCRPVHRRRAGGRRPGAGIAC